MQRELTKENMLLFFPSWLKPLSDKEINDFLISEPLVNNEYEKIEHGKLWYEKTVNNYATKKYNTKKEIKQEIKKINDELELWLVHKQSAPNEISKEFSEAHLEDLFKEKDNLKDKLRYVGIKFTNDKLMAAKQVPISDYLDFNSAGFARCLWHNEKTPSLHKITGKNKVYCFGCGKTADIVDIVMEQNGCSLPEALKIILG